MSETCFVIGVLLLVAVVWIAVQECIAQAARLWLLRAGEGNLRIPRRRFTGKPWYVLVYERQEARKWR